jgi:hypothetical protein
MQIQFKLPGNGGGGAGLMKTFSFSAGLVSPQCVQLLRYFPELFPNLSVLAAAPPPAGIVRAQRYWAHCQVQAIFF